MMDNGIDARGRRCVMATRKGLLVASAACYTMAGLAALWWGLQWLR